MLHCTCKYWVSRLDKYHTTVHRQHLSRTKKTTNCNRYHKTCLGDLRHAIKSGQNNTIHRHTVLRNVEFASLAASVQGKATMRHTTQLEVSILCAHTHTRVQQTTDWLCGTVEASTQPVMYQYQYSSLKYQYQYWSRVPVQVPVLKSQVPVLVLVLSTSTSTSTQVSSTSTGLKYQYLKSISCFYSKLQRLKTGNVCASEMVQLIIHLTQAVI